MVKATRTVIVAHRGGALAAPENTLPAFRQAAALGVPWQELDVRLTRDGELVCFHDDRLERVTPAAGRVDDADWSALKDVPVMPGAFENRFSDARIPRLADVLREIPRECRFVVELKAEPTRPDELVRRTLEVIAEHGPPERCRVISFDFDLLRRVRSAPPTTGGQGNLAVELGVLVNARERDRLLPRAREVRAAFIHPPKGIMDTALMRAARDEGFLVNAWTVNTPEEIRRLAGLGVDEITTDDPEMALRVLSQV